MTTTIGSSIPQAPTPRDARAPDSILLPLVSRLSIATKAAAVKKFEANWAQRLLFAEIERQLRAGVPIRLIVLKARQIGVSTAIEAFIYVMTFIIANLRGTVIANEVPNAHHLLAITDLYWESDPFRELYHTKYQAKNTLHWVETNSSIQTATAGNKEAGRSRTIHMLHASEVAFWLEAEKVTTGLMEAVPELPRTMVALESTANGVGNYFYKQWHAAMSGKSGYEPMFFPWWAHPEYRASHLGLPPRDLRPYDEEERELIKLWKQGLTVGRLHFEISPQDYDDALAWRRHKIVDPQVQGDLNKFHQEYPSTPEEAFIATGTNVFPVVQLNKCFVPESGQKGRLRREGATVVFQPDVSGPLVVYRKPSPDQEYGIYVVGADATATMHGDFAVAQIFNQRTLEQVAVWRGRIDPAHFGEECAKIGVFYHMALLAPENEGPGFSTIGALIQLDYSNLFQSTMPDNLPGRYVGKWGWSSSYKTKEFAIGWLLKLVIDGQILIHDRRTYDEMINYVTLENGGYGNADGEAGHDDTVMAVAIAVAASRLSGPVPVYGANVGSEDRSPSWEEWTSQVPDLEMT